MLANWQFSAALRESRDFAKCPHTQTAYHSSLALATLVTKIRSLAASVSPSYRATPDAPQFAHEYVDEPLLQNDPNLRFASRKTPHRKKWRQYTIFNYVSRP